MVEKLCLNMDMWSKVTYDDTRCVATVLTRFCTTSSYICISTVVSFIGFICEVVCHDDNQTYIYICRHISRNSSETLKNCCSYHIDQK